MAYKSSIAMVKITSRGTLNYSSDTLIMRGIKFLIDKSKGLKKPLIINLSFSTNDGSHDGSSLFEQYISTVCKLESISFAVAAGNEGDAGHHVGGDLKPMQTISMSISPNETGIILQMYKTILNDLTIEIINPSGDSSGNINLKEGYIEGRVGRDMYYIYDTGPKPYNMSGEIIISLVSSSDFILSGVWRINIISENNYKGQFDVWMPISESLSPTTRFLNADVYDTLGIPATVEDVISVGSYNSSNNTISTFSGRGSRYSSIIKPDIVAPGEEVLSSIPRGRFDTKTGTSMATPQVTGILALFMQWGMVKGNDPFLYGDRLKYYILKGARRNRTDVSYPNQTWGYGEVCADNAFNLLNTLIRGEENKMRKETTQSRPQYESYIVEYTGDILEEMKNIDYATVFIADEEYAIVSVQKGKEEQLLKDVSDIVYRSVRYRYTLNQTSPVDIANITEFHNSKYLNLTGSGVLVGLVDTGLDYLNTEFINENDTTRILSIWDQTDNDGQYPEGLPYGREYTREEINSAIKAKKEGQDPYNIVKTKDNIGHGTRMAGIIGAKGKNREVIGAAPDCEFVVVKLKTDQQEEMESNGKFNFKKVPVYNGVNIITGIKYLFNTAKKYEKPMVIYVPLGSNGGPHDGNTIIEKYIDSVSKVRGIVVVTGLGNQGNTDTHTEGVLEQNGDVKTIELKVSPLEKNLTFEIWCRKPDKVSLSMVSPSGEIIEKIPAKLKNFEKINLVFEGSKVGVEYLLPEEITGDELIRINIEDIREGIWQFKLIGDFIIDGRFDAWLPQRPLIEEGTRFLNSSPFTTLETPSTSRGILCCSYYNQNNNSMVVESSRGYTRDGRIAPNIACGGVNAKTTSPGGQVVTVSGSSVGSALYAGACALLLQWGIVEGNDTTLYAIKMKTYFIRGASRRKGEKYPNKEWGYGTLNFRGLFENIRSIIDENVNFKEKQYGNIFIRYLLKG